MPHMFRGTRWLEWSPVPLRLVIGFGFMAHGWAKFSRGPEKFGDLLHWIGIPFPHAAAWMVTLLELSTGLAMFMGAFVALISIPMACILLVAIATVHLQYGFSSVNTIGLTAAGPRFGPPGYEVDLLYLGGLLVLALRVGAGPLSIDRLRARRAQRQVTVEQR
jgi:putative oxidoreductase